jgi:hypothetical protein
VAQNYEDMRDFFVRKGLSESVARTKAAKPSRIVSQQPVTRQPSLKASEDKEQ